MVKSLVLLRHGEAISPDDSNLDRNKILSKEGRMRLGRLNVVIQMRNVNFDLVVVSPSRRTLETAEIICGSLDIKRLIEEPSIYESSVSNLYSIVQNFPAEANSVLLIGHNPGLSGLLAFYTGDYPLIISPGMMCFISFQLDDWKLLESGTGSLTEVIQ